jgi:hypothetical protein
VSVSAVPTTVAATFADERSERTSSTWAAAWNASPPVRRRRELQRLDDANRERQVSDRSGFRNFMIRILREVARGKAELTIQNIVPLICSAMPPSSSDRKISGIPEIHPARPPAATRGRTTKHTKKTK